MDLFDIIIISVILGVIGKGLFWVWIAWTVGRAAHGAYQIYNGQIEAGLRQLAMEIQAHHNQQARAIEAAMRQRVAALPRRERVVYKNRLSDVVRGKKVLNPATGEWETVS